MRENGSVRSKGLLCASVSEKMENVKYWALALLIPSLKPAGASSFCLERMWLTSVDFVVSDNHGGLVNAIRKLFQGAPGNEVKRIFQEMLWINAETATT